MYSNRICARERRRASEIPATDVNFWSELFLPGGRGARAAGAAIWGGARCWLARCWFPLGFGCCPLLAFLFLRGRLRDRPPPPPRPPWLPLPPVPPLAWAKVDILVRILRYGRTGVADDKADPPKPVCGRTEGRSRKEREALGRRTEDSAIAAVRELEVRIFGILLEMLRWPRPPHFLLDRISDKVSALHSFYGAAPCLRFPRPDAAFSSSIPSLPP